MSTDVRDKNKTDGVVDEYSYKPRERSGASSRQRKQAPKSNRMNKKIIIIPVVVIIALLACVVALSCSLPTHNVADNVYVNGLNVGGMNEAEAAQAVGELILADDEYTIRCMGKTAVVNASDIELCVDAEETARKAVAIGKSKNIFKNAYYAVKLMTGKETVTLVPEYNQELLDKLLFEFGTTINGISSGPQYEYTDTSMTITPGTSGQNQDTSVARNQFLAAVGEGVKDNIEVTLEYAEPQLLNADEIYNEICKPAQDAYFDKTETGGIVVRDEVVGIELNKDELKKAIDKVNNMEKATLPANIIQPKKTKKELEANLFSSTLGSYSSDFSSSSENRALNVKKASEAVNGKILMPGDTFSYNGTIGNPSLANGYKVASVFENGKTTQGVGGGVCQVSSTLYCAVLYADLSVVERHNHSLTVGYVPNGQDATVSYGSLDFKFKNNTEYPIKINSVVNGRKLSISIIGAKYSPERKIEITNKTVSTIVPTETEIPDPSLPVGTRKVSATGKKGYVVDTYKTVYENGVKKSTNKITRSTYKMVPTEVLVGSGTADSGTSSAPPSGAVTEGQPSGAITGGDVPTATQGESEQKNSSQSQTSSEGADSIANQ